MTKDVLTTARESILESLAYIGKDVAAKLALLARFEAVLTAEDRALLEATKCSIYVAHAVYSDAEILLTPRDGSKDHPALRRMLARIAENGKAVKSVAYDGTSITVEAKIGPKLTVRLCSEVPASCRIVEEEIDVPEKVVAAHKEIKKRVICNEDDSTPEAPAPANPTNTAEETPPEAERCPCFPDPNDPTAEEVSS